MDKFLINAFKMLPSRKVPDELHASIMRAAMFQRSWRYARILTLVLGVMFVLTLWNLYSRSVETESIFTIRTVFDTWDPTFDSIVDSLRTLFENLPVQAIMIMAFNFVALVFMMFVLNSFNRIQEQFRLS